jgi:hypothetical protein
MTLSFVDISNSRISNRMPIFIETLIQDIIGQKAKACYCLLERINLMVPLYFYRYQKRASVCRSVPPLTRGGQEGFAAVEWEWAWECDLPPHPPSFPPCQGGSGQTTAFIPIPTAASCDCLGSDMAIQKAAWIAIARRCYAHSFVNLL